MAPQSTGAMVSGLPKKWWLGNKLNFVLSFFFLQSNNDDFNNDLRGRLRSLWVGVLIALPSGAGVALSILGGNAGSLVGVAISASLLPPVVNAVIFVHYYLSWIAYNSIVCILRNRVYSGRGPL